MVNRLQALCQNIGSCRGPICTDISHSGRCALISDIHAEDGRRAVVSDGLVVSRMVEGGASGREGEKKGKRAAATGIQLPGSWTLQRRKKIGWTFFVIKHKIRRI